MLGGCCAGLCWLSQALRHVGVRRLLGPSAASGPAAVPACAGWPACRTCSCFGQVPAPWLVPWLHVGPPPLRCFGRTCLHCMSRHLRQTAQGVHPADACAQQGQWKHAWQPLCYGHLVRAWPAGEGWPCCKVGCPSVSPVNAEARTTLTNRARTWSSSTVSTYSKCLCEKASGGAGLCACECKAGHTRRRTHCATALVSSATLASRRTSRPCTST